MTVNSPARSGKVAGAASPETVDWHRIDWQKVHRNVRRLQARIVKAMQSRVPHRALERLEPCVWKQACTVLRGLRASNGPRLPDRTGKEG
jgi:RNA-directed DNA polymerase